MVIAGSHTADGQRRWMPAVAAGYVASIYAHRWINEALSIEEAHNGPP